MQQAAVVKQTDDGEKRGAGENGDHLLMRNAVHREQTVVRFGRAEQSFRHDQIEAHERRGDTADKEKYGDGTQIQQRDALVIGG